MKTKIILNRDVPNIGEEGEVYEVVAGYARNYLIPRGLAMSYNRTSQAIIEGRRTKIEQRQRAKQTSALDVKQQLEEQVITIRARAGENGRLYGAVTSAILVDELARQGIAIERKRVYMPMATIKNIGQYTVELGLYQDVKAHCTVAVISDKPDDESAVGDRALVGEKGERRAIDAATPAIEVDQEAITPQMAPTDDGTTATDVSPPVDEGVATETGPAIDVPLAPEATSTTGASASAEDQEQSTTQPSAPS